MEIDRQAVILKNLVKSESYQQKRQNVEKAALLLYDVSNYRTNDAELLLQYKKF